MKVLPGLRRQFGSPGRPDRCPGEDQDGKNAVGMVEIRYGTNTPYRPQQLQPPDPAMGDRFGAAVAVAELNDDYCDDLLVGVPYRTVDGVHRAGAVAVYLGSQDKGLQYAGLLAVENGISGSPQPHKQFGAAVDAAGNRVFIGVPGRDTYGVENAGAVVELTTESRDGELIISHSAEMVQGRDVPGKTETGDRWGASISAGDEGNFAAGAPGESVGDVPGAGAVIDRWDGKYTVLSQDTPGMSGAPEEGDNFGKALTRSDYAEMVFIGVPSEDVSDAEDAGMVNLWTPPWSEDEPGEPGPGVSQDTPGISGGAEPGDHFGAALAAQGLEGSVFDFWVGAPGEDIRDAENSGMVAALGYDGGDAVEEDGGFSGDNTVGGVQSNAGFGSALGLAGDKPYELTPPLDLYIGAPGRGSGGAVVHLPEQEAGKAKLLTQTTSDDMAADMFGDGLSLPGRLS